MKGAVYYDNFNTFGSCNIDRTNYDSSMRVDCNHPAAGRDYRYTNNCRIGEVDKEEEITT